MAPELFFGKGSWRKGDGERRSRVGGKEGRKEGREGYLTKAAF